VTDECETVFILTPLKLPLVKKERLAKLIKFARGSLPVDALNPQTMRDLWVIAKSRRDND